MIQELHTTITYKNGRVQVLPYYWEAFRIDGGKGAQDTFIIEGTGWAQFQVHAEAIFYRHLKLSSDFKVVGTDYTANAPSTLINHHLGPGSAAPIIRGFLSKYHKGH